MDLEQKLYVVAGRVGPDVEHRGVDLVCGHALRTEGYGFTKRTIIIPSSKEMSATSIKSRETSCSIKLRSDVVMPSRYRENFKVFRLEGPNNVLW